MINKEKLFTNVPVEDYLKQMNEVVFEGGMIVPVVAIDDGYAQYNAAVLTLTKNGDEYVPRIVELVMPALARRGQHLNSSIGGVSGLYGTYDSGEQYSVHPHISEPEDTRNDEYPVSTLSLCLTHAVLDKLGLQGKDCAIATGLPLEVFMDGESGKNDKLISKKVNNLKRDVYITNESKPSANILFVGVYPEAIAGMLDYMINELGGKKENIDPSLTRLAIDIGGNTTDLAIILEGGIVGSKLTLKQGVKHVKDKLRKLLLVRFDYEPDDYLLEQALTEGVVSFFGGDEVDVTLEVADAVGFVMNPVMAQIDSFKKSYPSLREIVGFGGGVALMEGVIRDKYPNIIIMENPSGANARGILKASLVFDFDEIMGAVKTAIENKSEELV